jgi:hypothetical protein
MKNLFLLVALFLGGIIIWVAADTYRNHNIDRIAPRDRSLTADKNTSKVLDAIVKGEQYNAQIIKTANHWVSNRYDASDFRLQSLARIIYQHKDSIAVKDFALIKDSFINFKYWMDQPGQDGMCFWSENHQLLFAASEYLAGQYWPNEKFTNTGLTGADHKAMAEQRILTWLEQRWLYGFTEWYSNTYYTEDIAPLSNLIDFADNPEIVTKAKIIMDLLLYDLATQSFRGTFISSSGRMYGNGKLNPFDNSMAGVNDHIWDPARWGRKPKDKVNMSLNFIYRNNYEVPPVIIEIGFDDQREVIIKGPNGLNLTELDERDLIGLEDRQIMMQWAMEAFSNPEIIENTVAYLKHTDMMGNGFLHDLKYFDLGVLRVTGTLPLVSKMLKPKTDGVAIQRANTYTYKTPDYMVASAQAYHPGTYGDQQHLWNAALSNLVSIFVMHPAKPLSDKSALSGSPGYWVGAGRFPHVVQDTNVVLNIYDLPTEPGFMETSVEGFTHAHFPSERLDQVILEDNYAFGRVGDSYAAFVATNPLSYAAGSSDDLIQQGRNTFWVFEAGSKTRDGSFADFSQRIKDNAVTFANNTLTYVSKGRTLSLSYQSDFLINGETQSFDYPRFDSPYAKVEREPKEMTISHNGKSLYLDFYNQVREYQ